MTVGPGNVGLYRWSAPSTDARPPPLKTSENDAANSASAY